MVCILQAYFYLETAENWLFKRRLQICVPVITQNNTSYPKSLIINYYNHFNQFQRVFLLVKTCFYWSKPPYIYDNHWYNITKRVLLLSRIPPNKNGTQHKWNLAKMTSHKIGISKLALLVFWSTINILLIEPSLQLDTNWKNSIWKSHDHGSESHYKLKNSLSKIIQLSPSQITFGQFFARRAIFARHHFLWVLYLSILGRVFVMYHFCKVPLFSNGTKECFFCWVLFLLGLSDGVVFCFF